MHKFTTVIPSSGNMCLPTPATKSSHTEAPTVTPTSSASKAMVTHHTKAKTAYFIPSLTEKAVEASPLLLLLFCVYIAYSISTKWYRLQRLRLVLLANHITPSIYKPICTNRHTLSLRPTGILMRRPSIV